MVRDGRARIRHWPARDGRFDRARVSCRRRSLPRKRGAPRRSAVPARAPEYHGPRSPRESAASDYRPQLGGRWMAWYSTGATTARKSPTGMSRAWGMCPIELLSTARRPMFDRGHGIQARGRTTRPCSIPDLLYGVGEAVCAADSRALMVRGEAGRGQDGAVGRHRRASRCRCPLDPARHGLRGRGRHRRRRDCCRPHRRSR